MRKESKGCLTFVIAVIVIISVLWGIGFLFTGGSDNGDKNDAYNYKENNGGEEYNFGDYLKEELTKFYNAVNN
ncbi:MAG: hypothetical protein IJ408_03160 [Clostridia bacterium]|nr:hypothetical protein [Clostridia bacterium]